MRSCNGICEITHSETGRGHQSKATCSLVLFPQASPPLPPLVRGPRIPGMSNARLYSHPRTRHARKGMMDRGMRSAACHYLYMYETGTILSLVMKVECQYTSSHGGYTYSSNSSSSNTVSFN